MQLNPSIKAFLDQFASVPGPKMWEQAATEGRQAFVALMQLAGPKDVPIGATRDIKVPGTGGAIPLRIYTPVRVRDQRLPALVYFHGGGFVVGDLDTHDGLCRQLANESGCRVIAVDYRLAPEHKFPAAVDDAYAAVAFVAAKAGELGVDAGRIAVGGDSAGGALAAVVTQIARDKGGPRLAFQLLLFPVTQIGGETPSLQHFAEGYFLEQRTLDWFFGHYLGDAANKSDVRISPLKARSFNGLPPALVMLGGFDPLHDEGAQYAEKLRAAGVPVTVADYGDMVHCFIYLQAISSEAAPAVAEAAKALKNALVT
jgi:acetyl esterase